MPDISTSLVRGHLQNVSLKYHEASHIAGEVYPALEMPTSLAKVAVYNRGDQYRIEAKERTRGTEAAARDMKVSFENVDTVQYAVKQIITKEDLRDLGLEDGSAPPLNIVQDAIEQNAKDLDRLSEKRVADSIFAATWLDGVAGGTDKAAGWAPVDSTNTFLADIETAKAAFVAAGIDPRTGLRLMLDVRTMNRLKRVAAITDQLKYTSSQSLSAETLARMLEIDAVVVGSAIYSSANETKLGTDFTGRMIWEKNATKGSAFLYHFPKNVGLKTMAAGYQPKRKVEGGQYRANYVHQISNRHTFEYEAQEEIGVKVIATNAGYLWVDTLVT